MQTETFNLAVLAGDGIGPEVMCEAVKVLRAIERRFALRFNLTEAPAGWAGIDAAGDALPEATLALCRKCDAILFGSVGLPARDVTVQRDERPERAALMRLRHEFGLFANLRPIRLWPELAHACPIVSERREGEINLLIVRELTAGVYFGKPKSIELLENGERRAIDTTVYTSSEIRRIAHVAFQLAEARSDSRKAPKVTSIDKMNILENGVLWREEVTKVAKQYPRVELEHMLVDNAAMQILLKPTRFDVLLCENLFGDILSDEAAALAGSLGMVPSASLGASNGDRVFGLYEPAGGSAPDIAGKNSANPIAQILSAALMLKHSFKRATAHDAIVNAIQEVLAAGYRTPDICGPSEATCVKVGTSEMGDAIAAAV